MSARKRRTPLGTQPPITSESGFEAAGTIDKTDPIELSESGEPIDTRLEAHKKALAADQEHTIIVQIDDEWLERLELPID